MRTQVLRSLWLSAMVSVFPGSSVHADTDGVLARLGRVARGDWMMAPRRAPKLAYVAEIRVAAQRHGLSPSLLAALVRAESGFNPWALSSKGAQGLGQLMPATARELGVRNPFDPTENLNGSARYLSRQLDRFHNVAFALAAYHAGPKRASRGATAWPRETRAYVSRVMRFEREYRRRGIP